MSIITISSIFNFEYDDYKAYCNTVISDFITTTPYEDTLDLYIYLPIWLRYRDTPIKFNNDDKGKDDFLRNFNNQLTEVVFDFHNYAKENIEYFLYQNDVTKQGKPMSKTITSGIAPINQKIDQALDSTNLASGTGSQFVSETVYNGVAWHKLIEGYFTPNRKTTLLKAFQWLFISVYSPETKYDDKIEQVRYVELSFVDDDNNIIDEQKVYPTKSYFTMSEVDIARPENLEPQNIKKDVEIAGIVGTYESVSNIYPRIYDVLRLDNPDGIIGYNTPSGYDGIEGVTISIPNTAVAENIKAGVNIGGIIGTYSVPDYLSLNIDADYSTPYNYVNNTVTTLRRNAFNEDKNIGEITLSAVTKSNGANCFANSSVTKAFFPSVLTLDQSSGNLWQGTFANCSNLTEVHFPILTTINGSVSNFFLNCISLITVDFHSLLSFGSNATGFFSGCSSLQQIDLNEANRLPYNTFNGCTSLSDITLKNGSVVQLVNQNAIPTGQNIKIHVPSSLISSYQTATNWSTLYNNGDVTFVAI